MKQPRVFAKSMILDAAFSLLREKGLKAVTAREIAKRLGSSTMPIYSHMKSLEDLEKELRIQAVKLLEDYQRRPFTAEKLMNVSIGYVAFARDEKQLFRYLFLDSPIIPEEGDPATMRESFYSRFGDEGGEAEVLRELPDKSQENLMRNSHIYTHGLAMMVCGGIMGPWSDERIQSCLMDAGQAFYMLELQKGAGE